MTLIPSKTLTTLKSVLLVAGFVTAFGARLGAQPITVPNYSFELPPTGFVDTTVNEWQKAPEAAYWPAIQSQTGYSWDQLAGVFLDTNPYINRDGSQAAYILSFPGVALYQDYESTSTHDFNAIYNVGRSYNLTVSVFGKSSVAPGSTLDLILYYRDSLDNMVTVGSTTITYDPSLFPMPTNAPLSLVDFSVNVPIVQAGDAWAGQHIGIEVLSTTPLQQATGGNWDLDNVRLTETPEPSTAALLAIGAAAAWLRRRKAVSR